MAAALVSACGASSISDYSSSKSQLADRSQSQAPGNTGTPSQSQEETIKKVADKYTAIGDPHSSAYKIGPRDVLDITVFEVPDLSKIIQVSEAGTINYPLVGELMAGGKTAREIELELTKKLGAKYLQNPAVTVFVKEHNSQRVTVEGAVNKPGVIPMAGGVSLLQAVAQSGGLNSNADKTAVVFRTVDGKRSAGKYDISDIRAGKAEDPQLQSGDVVIVPTSDMREGLDIFVKFLPLAVIAPYL
ncbi:MAG: polysaccharide biosynthesis/export family protein [Rhodomicrobium sp.]